MGIERGRRRIRVLCPSCVLPWESIELDCNWLKRVPFAHSSATHAFFPSHIPSYHFSVLFHMKSKDLALLNEKSLYFKPSDTSYAINSFTITQLTIWEKKNKTKHTQNDLMHIQNVPNSQKRKKKNIYIYINKRFDNITPSLFFLTLHNFTSPI